MVTVTTRPGGNTIMGTKDKKISTAPTRADEKKNKKRWLMLPLLLLLLLFFATAVVSALYMCFSGENASSNLNGDAMISPRIGISVKGNVSDGLCDNPEFRMKV